ncbi:MFS transporter [Streptomyces sp. NPDC085612]|uniref:MFS transporter n=1 Tax=Streptomyces sp. NPDC085612 TaxID=3365732 RepID=UPI0037D03BE5
MGRRFGWLWAAYAVNAFGTWLAFDAFALVAILVLHAGPAEVSLLTATGLAVGTAAAVPLGPWVEFRRKRPVMIAMDLTRCAALASIPVAYVLGVLGLAQLVVVSVVVSAAGIAFGAAAGAYLRSLVPAQDLLVANGRFESTNWTATVLGPPLGTAAIGLFGPVVTLAADAVSHLLSAVGLRAIGGGEPPPPARTGRSGGSGRLRRGELLEGWRYILTHPALRPLFFNTVLVNALIMATAPLLAVLMLGDLGFAPWQYGLAFALITCTGVFNPVFATHRLEQVPADRTARTLAAWSVSGKTTVAALTALWGLLAGLTGPRAAIGAAGLLMLFTPLLLPRREG